MKHPVSLDSSKDFFEEIVEIASEGKWVVNLQGLIVYSNRQMGNMLGCTKSKFLKKFFYNWLRPLSGQSDPSSNCDYWKKFLVEIQSSTDLQSKWGECSAITESGEERNWKFYISKMSPCSSGALHFVITALDVTSQTGIHEVLTENEHQFRILAESIPQLVWIAQADGKIIWCNQRWYQYSGTTPKEMTQIGWEAFHESSELPQVLEWWNASLHTGEPSERAIRLRGSDQSYRWFLSRMIPVRNRFGKIIRWFGTNTDIDEIKRAEFYSSTLQEFTTTVSRLNHLKSITQSMISCGVKALGSYKTFILLLNEEENCFEIIDEEGFDPVLHGRKYPAQSTSSLRSALMTGRVQIIETRESAAIKSPEALSFMSEQNIETLVLAPFLIEEKFLGLLCLSYQRRRTLRADDLEFLRTFIDQSTQALARSQLIKRLEREVQTRDRFLSIASHELKTPITALKLQLQIMLRQIVNGNSPTSEKFSRSLNISSLQLDRLTRLVEDLLDVSKIHSGKLDLEFEEVNFSQMIQEIINKYADQLDAVSCTLQMRIEPDMVGLADPNRLEQVFVNLISNIIKYAPGKPLQMTGRKMEEVIEISFRDFGPGIPPDKQKSVFGRFERAVTNRNVTGLGLGLFIADEIIKAHGGTIRLESEVGKGSNFIVSIPLIPERDNKRTLTWQVSTDLPLKGHM